MEWKKLLNDQRLGESISKYPSRGSRSRFEQDFDRLIFSHPFRRLQDKTQVFPLPEDDFVHSRLTHSLEVSSVGRSLGKAVGERLTSEHPELGELGYNFHDFGAIVAAACLAHDLGNPPFGHSGETAISSFFLDNAAGQIFKTWVTKEEWVDLTNFEGNAQGFRILNNQDNGGLKLTFASLGAFTKYPKTSSVPNDADRKSQKKFGIYRNDLLHFEEMAKSMGMVELGVEKWCRHPLTFLVEAADDICYHIIDLEDGCRLGLVSFEQTKDLLAAIIGDRFQADKLEKYADDNQKISLLRAMAITRLIDECVELFLAKEDAILTGSFDEALTEKIASADALKNISQVSIQKIYRSKNVLEREAGGFEVIGRLMEAFCVATHHKFNSPPNYTPKMRAIYRLLPTSSQQQLERSSTISTYELLMIVMDFVSSLTDSYAIKLYRIISGFSLPTSKA